MLKGIAASPGYGAGPALVLRPRPALQGRRTISTEQLEAELARFEAAVQKAAKQLQKLEERAKRDLGEENAQIFVAHQLFLQDPEFIGGMKAKIEQELLSPENAVSEVTEQFSALFAAMDDEYMKERAADIRDVGGRVLDLLMGVSGPDWGGITEPVVVIANDLTPSDTAQLDPAKVLGFATEIGGRTSHSAIMARSLEIPAVVGLGELLSKVEDGQPVLLDGEAGTLTIGVDTESQATFASKATEYRERRERLQLLKEQPSVTVDGHKVEVVANIGRPADVAGALKNGAEGVGLFRSEFLYMDRSTFPTEDEQYEAYSSVIKALQPGQPLIVRTLDIGGDKELDYLELPKEMNPFLGYRAIRLCLEEPDLFGTQLRAILRASAHGNVKIMFPMIATLDELRRAKAQVEIAKEALRERGVAFNEKIDVGIMIEVPAAALNADHLAKEVDFFSIGTNDMVQYTMACDRMNERVSYLYQPFEPSVLRLIKMVIDGAHAAGKWAGMCGEMASDPLATPLLLGLGLDEFSMSSISILPVREQVTSLSYEKAKQWAEHALTLGTAQEVRDYIASEVAAHANRPDRP